jgi:hypothetical protein
MKQVLSRSIWMLLPASLIFLALPAAAQYVGAKKCMPCHIKQHKSWKVTRMAKSFDLLKPGTAADAKKAQGLDPAKDYTTDAECLACHTTGYGQPGGFVSLAKTPKLTGIQCETCHGPGGPYLKPHLMSLKNKNYKRDELVAAGMVIPSEKTCLTCHNEKSPFFKPFDYEARKIQGTHEHLPLKFSHD